MRTIKDKVLPHVICPHEETAEKYKKALDTIYQCLVNYSGDKPQIKYCLTVTKEALDKT